MSEKSFEFNSHNRTIISVRFPISGNRDDAVNNGRMSTSFNLSRNGNLTAVTNTRTKVKMKGFTGAASIILLDAAKQPVWASAVRTYGIDGCFVGRCNRNDNWSENVPSNIMEQVRGFSILQQHEPRYRIFDRGQQFLTWLSSSEGKAVVGTIASIAVML